MSPRRRPVPRPLAPRDGIDPVSVRIPAEPAVTIRGYLAERHPSAAREIDRLIRAGEILDGSGAPITPSTVCGGGTVWYHRPLPTEPDLPQDLPVLHEDEWLLAVDKPHGLPTTPRGGFVAQTALSVLRRRRSEDALVPAHRLDRDTAGVLLLIRDPAVRGAVQRQFQERTTAKTYLAVVALGTRALEELPIRRESRIEKQRGILQATEVPGPVDAVTEIAPLAEFRDDEGRWAVLELRPRTGRTHQLRVHLNALGLPIRRDPLYPRILPREPGDVSRPLQLLARSLTLRHPVTGRVLVLASRRRLETVPSEALATLAGRTAGPGCRPAPSTGPGSHCSEGAP